ncbi:MAG: hypothetical protein O2779_02315 [Nanoarchaeota archaeon]|nr:hypothetical protein [Nanoarchaeota archaeon]
MNGVRKLTFSHQDQNIPLPNSYAYRIEKIVNEHTKKGSTLDEYKSRVAAEFLAKDISANVQQAEYIVRETQKEDNIRVYREQGVEPEVHFELFYLASQSLNYAEKGIEVYKQVMPQTGIKVGCGALEAALNLVGSGQDLSIVKITIGDPSGYEERISCLRGKIVLNGGEKFADERKKRLNQDLKKAIEEEKYEQATILKEPQARYNFRS